ncbi:MAG: hypothetical protein HKP45_05400 [Winogradskyella sp.]|nr:hypothetical protein [Winogradskyella sp.]MBT8376388.1 hypothetical protein [Bacteroidia bacterium]NNF86664.1 hypothetical protein [Winogradskyella sp.]NNK40073.1 hypothetical protein [Winogradskyella sp.]NNL82521.1 hypothetical protein [Winogradskyella sp.]
MTTTTVSKPPVSFWIISAIALVWNILGVMAYLGRAFMTEDMIATLPAEQQAEFLVEYPAWYTAAFAFAVFFGALGCLLLLFRKKLAYGLLIISFIGVIVQHGYLFMNVDMSSYIMPILVIVVSAFLVWYSKSAIVKGWLK